MPHVLGNAGGPPPPTRNETLLHEAVDRLRADLATAREERDDCQAQLERVLHKLGVAQKVIAVARDAFPRVWEGPVRERCRAALAVYDKAMGGN
jgi:hypothetical protein